MNAFGEEWHRFAPVGALHFHATYCPPHQPALPIGGWRVLVAEALDGKPGRLLDVLTFPHLVTGGRSFTFGPGPKVCLRTARGRISPWQIQEMRPSEVRPSRLPRRVAAVVADLRRVRRGRPARDDATHKAAAMWQREEARRLYRWVLLAYQLARIADSAGAAAEYASADVYVVDIGVRSRVPVARGFGSPKEFALERVAGLVGRQPEAVRKLIYGRPRT